MGLGLGHWGGGGWVIQGTIILHVTPDAASGGPLAFVRNGDRMRLSVKDRRIDLLVDESEIVDLATAVPALPQEMCAFLRAGQPALDAAQHALAHRSARLRLSDVWLDYRRLEPAPDQPQI